MTQARLRQRGWTAILFAVCATLFTACGQAPSRDTPEEPPPDTGATTTDAPLAMHLPASVLEREFRAVEAALDAGELLAADVALADLADVAATSDDAHYLAYLGARRTYLGGDGAGARRQLQALLAEPLHPGVRYRTLSLLAHIDYLARDYIASARAVHDLLSLGALANAGAWRRQLWRALQRAEVDALFSAEAAPSEREWQGWLALALAARATGFARDSAIARWRQEFPEHSAAGGLPGGLEQLRAAPAGAAHAALLLPLTGRLALAGRAVLDGYLAAHYSARGRGEPTPQLTILDESDFTSPLAAYDEALRAGADIVIGPLTKPAVAELGTQLERPVPVLALNHADQLLPASGSPLVQLALAPEEEAAQLADYAFGSGARQAVILSPRGPWGDELQSILGERWRALGGRIVASSSYVDEQEYSESIERALGLAESTARAQLVEDLLGVQVLSTPRRRQDADVVFLLARNSAQAKALKPLLAFHYAGDLPVYALSSAYNGVPRSDNRDLRGVYLLETPWLLAEQDALRSTLEGDNLGGGAYPRLNAMGADAFLLQAEFARLAGGPDALLRGSTGLLSMDAQLRIRRELTPAAFDGDRPRPR